MGIAAAAVTTALGTGAASGAAAQAAPVTDSIALNKTFDLGGFGQAVNGDTKHFAGLYVDEAHHTITVYTAGASAVAEARSALAAQHNASPRLATRESPALAATTSYRVQYVAVKHSQQAMLAAQAAITAHRTIDGVPWNVVGPNPKANQVFVGVTNPTAKLAARLRAQYGDLVRVVKQGPVSDMVKRIQFPNAAAADAYVHRDQRAHTVSPHDSSSYSRYSDAAPWFGGDRIDTFTNSHTAVVSCTAGFGYTDPYYAPAQMLFAGHCGASGAYWWNASQNNGWTGQFMGITGWQSFNNGHTDAALITLQGTTLAPDIYTRNNTYWPYVGEAYNFAGNQFCTDGSYSQEICTGQIDACGQTVSVPADGATEYDMCTGHPVGGTGPLSQPGDSGGPVISGSPMQVRGVIAGGDGGSFFFFTPWEAVNRMIGGHPCPC
ncbi:hypothetical protein KGA66_09970 [Actinocrinis puniceicyclus]|uniref:Peptidase S1 domain-containing protein n=1 Tax=Actinocrinis puniceicyclus TaxID=977794 RepID=A0A8J7WNI0_9ACTN|nr:hypothetical protein [Actinocrinis puniceicyclus]MBS2963372.1 hypothetical protein [Actinocrinis puniceicyclus]